LNDRDALFDDAVTRKLLRLQCLKHLPHHILPNRGNKDKHQSNRQMLMQCRLDTKQATLIAMLREPDGATIDVIASARQWAPLTIRGAMSGALKKKLGLKLT